MEFLFGWGLFSVKFITGSLLAVFAFVFVLVAAKLAKGDSNSKKEKVKFTNLLEEVSNRKTEIEDAIASFDTTLDDKSKKKALKLKSKSSEKDLAKLKEDKLSKIEKSSKEGKFCPEQVFVIDFVGDTKATEQKDLIKKINVILDVATDKDEVIVNLDSPGGVVNGYGLCASQFERIRDKGIHLTVCVDNVAASGGYLMSCVATKIVAAPFAYIGSIGVVATVPNFNKVLKKHDVEYEQVTAGKYKRTLTMFGENTEEARAKFKTELEGIHKQFKAIVSKYRPTMDIENVATGEFWLASDAFERGLIDEINTFDAYLQNCLEFTKVCAIKISIERQEKNSLKDIFKKFLSAKTWTKALKEEVQDSIEDNSTYQIK